MVKAQKKAPTGKFIAIAQDNGSSCSHEEFTSPEKAASDQVNSDNVTDGDFVTVYKKVGVFRITTNTTLTKSR